MDQCWHMHGRHREVGILSVTELDEFRLLQIFPPVPIPAIIEERSVYAEESRSAVAGYLGHRWDAVADDVVRQSSDAFIYFTPKAYRYYLPALMRYCLRGQPFTQAIDPVVNALLRSPDPKCWEDRFLARWSEFSIAQLELIGQFLSVLEEDYGEYLLSERIARAKDTIDTLILLRMDRE